MSDVPAPFDEHRTVVRSEWIDHNGHMNAGYYMVVFDDAVTPWTRFIGFTPELRAANEVTTFSAEGHITYDREVLEGASLRVTTQLLGYDHKRIHCVHLMYHDGEGYLAATNELMTLHVSTVDRRVAPMATEILDRLASIWDAHRHLSVPDQVGRRLAVPGWSAGEEPVARAPRE